MWWKSSFVVLFCLLILSCKDDASKEEQKQSIKMEETFPFSDSEKVEIISYPCRIYWDTIQNNNGINILDPVVNKKLAVNTSGIKDRVILNDDSENKLFNYLFVNDCPDNFSVAGCFNPRHCVLFYNEQEEIIAYFEVCLDCGTYEASQGMEVNEICLERIGTLYKIFKQTGIKYFGEEK